MFQANLDLARKNMREAVARLEVLLETLPGQLLNDPALNKQLDALISAVTELYKADESTVKDENSAKKGVKSLILKSLKALILEKAPGDYTELKTKFAQALEARLALKTLLQADHKPLYMGAWEAAGAAYAQAPAVAAAAKPATVFMQPAQPAASLSVTELKESSAQSYIKAYDRLKFLISSGLSTEDHELMAHVRNAVFYARQLPEARGLSAYYLVTLVDHDIPKAARFREFERAARYMEEGVSNAELYAVIAKANTLMTCKVSRVCFGMAADLAPVPTP